MEYDELRAMMLKAFQEECTGRVDGAGQYGFLPDRVGKLAIEHKLIVVPADTVAGRRSGGLLPVTDRERIRQLFWEFIIQGIIVIGKDDHNETWPWYKVTEWGEKVLEEGEVVPHDPVGYIERLLRENPNLDPVMEFYLRESLKCFLTGTYTACSVMLGVASEKLILNLIDAIARALPTQLRQDKFKKATQNRQINRQWDELMKVLKPSFSQLPSSVVEDMDIFLNGVFHIIRRYRNQSGHPSSKKITREVAFCNLQLFPSYASHINELIKYLKTNALP